MYCFIKNTYNVDKKRNKIKSGLTTFMIFILLISIMVLIAFTSKGSKPITYKNIYVKKGDTLWAIVSKINTHNEDPRKLINQIKYINNLNDVRLQPGQKLKIPKY